VIKRDIMGLAFRVTGMIFPRLPLLKMEVEGIIFAIGSE
jgi:hypothetical protein